VEKNQKASEEAFSDIMVATPRKTKTGVCGVSEKTLAGGMN
jgi:hypothetical protein